MTSSKLTSKLSSLRNPMGIGTRSGRGGLSARPGSSTPTRRRTQRPPARRNSSSAFNDTQAQSSTGNSDREDDSRAAPQAGGEDEIRPATPPLNVMTINHNPVQPRTGAREQTPTTSPGGRASASGSVRGTQTNARVSARSLARADDWLAGDTVEEKLRELKKLYTLERERCRELEDDKKNATYRANELEAKLTAAKLALVERTAELTEPRAVAVSTGSAGQKRGATMQPISRVKRARRDNLAKTKLSRVSALHLAVFQCLKSYLCPLGKLVARSLDMTSTDEIIFSWHPSPRKIGPGNGKGPAYEGDVVPEPPMMTARRPHAAGGLYSLQWLWVGGEERTRGVEESYWALAAIGAATKDGSIEKVIEDADKDEVMKACKFADGPVFPTVRAMIKTARTNGLSTMKHRVFDDYYKALGLSPMPSKSQLRSVLAGTPTDVSLRVQFSRVLRDISSVLGVEVADVPTIDIAAEIRPAELVDVCMLVTPEMLSRWRAQSMAELRGGRAFPDPPDGEDCDSNITEETRRRDMLFKNTPAISAYKYWAGIPEIRSGEHVGALQGSWSVLSLARLDAWMMVKLIMCASMAKRSRVVVDGDDGVNGVMKLLARGGSKSLGHNAMFSKLLPRCVAGILQLCRDVVDRERPKELLKPFRWSTGKDFSPDDAEEFDALMDSNDASLPYADHLGDLHNNTSGFRKLTVGLIPDHDPVDYVYMSADAFRSHVCWWMGVASDISIGRSEREDDLEYAPITPGSIPQKGMNIEDESFDELSNEDDGE